MMKLRSSLMNHCKIASFLISKKEEQKFTFLERINLAIHLAMCKFCHTFVISCKKASFLIAKKEEQKFTFIERINLAIHLTMCKFCKAFEKQSSYISKQVKRLNSSAELTTEDKIRIEKSLEK